MATVKLVSAALASAGSHERAILKWTREIQKEMEEYKHTLATNAARVKAARMQAGAATARSAAPRGIDPYFAHAGTHGFMQDEINAKPVKGKARFYPMHLVKVDDGPVGSQSARVRDRSPNQRGRRSAPSRSAANATRRRGSIPGPTANAITEQDTATQLYAVFNAPVAVEPTPPTNSPPLPVPPPAPAPDATRALLTLPPGLNAAELKAIASSGMSVGDADESAAFRSPALYMDMKMRQLFHPDVNTTMLSASQKAHVIAHLLDTLGELVEPDSAQAYMHLSETIKELMLASEYKNLISVAPNNQTNTSTALTPSNSIPTSAHLASMSKEASRRAKSKWLADGRPRPMDYPIPSGGKSLSQSLADGSLDGPAGLVGGRFMTRIEKQREKDRLERERAELEYKLKNRSRYGSSEEDSTAQQFLLEVDSRRKVVPSIAFEGDANASARAATQLVNGVVPYKSSALNIAPSVFQHLRQIPAAYIEVAWSLKKEVHALCTRITQLEAAMASQKGELKKVAQEHSFLQNWNNKKTLQLQLYQRSEINLSNEIILLKNLLVDLKEEYETITEETILLEEDYLAHGIVFGGSYAMEEFRFEEEHRSYPAELQKKRKEMAQVLERIDQFKKDLLDIHTERDLLLTRIEVLEQAVNMMHNDSDEEEDDDVDDDEDDEEVIAARKARAAAKERDALLASSVTLDPSGYPFHQHQLDDLRGRGSSNTAVPSFLRFNGFFPNLNFSKQEVEVRIKEIWSLKTIADEKAKQVGGQQTGLKEYFEEYLVKRFQKGIPAKTHVLEPGNNTGVPSTLTPGEYAMQEFVINFFSTLEKHFVDQDFILFLKVILGELHEDHYRDQMKLLANFKDAVFRWDLQEHDISRGERIDGLIGKHMFMKGLRQFFPFKASRHMGELTAILERDCMTNGMVDGRKILSDGSLDENADDPSAHDGDGVDAARSDPSALVVDGSESTGGIYTSNFLECIRHQYLVEIENFVAKIRADLYALYEVRKVERAKALAATDENANSYSAMRHLERSEKKIPVLTAYDIRQVLRAADLNRSTEELTQFLKRGCNEPYLSKDTEIQIDRFMANLVASGLVHTTGHWYDEQHGKQHLRPSMRTRTMHSPDHGIDPSGWSTDSHAHAESSVTRPVFQRRQSMEDEANFFAARAGAETHPAARNTN